MSPWTLEAALEYIRELQPRSMDSGWCIFLGGGVLNRGFGPDLDLLAYPRTVESDLDAILAILPQGTWSSVGVADVYSYHQDRLLVELIFQRSTLGDIHDPR